MYLLSNLQFRCLPSVFVSVQYLQCIVQGFSYGIQNKLHSPTEWASWIPSTPKKKLTIHVRRLCCSRAPRAVQQRVPLDRASVTRCSAAWSDKRARGKGHRTNEFKDKPTSKKIREGREEVTVSVCVCVLCNPQSPQLADNRHS